MPLDYNPQEIAPRALEPVPPSRAGDTITGLTTVATYGTVPENQPASSVAAGADHIFAENLSFWKMLSAVDGPTEGSTVTLTNFVVTEWLPLRPGLFHTDEGRWARDEAIRSGQIRPDDAHAPPTLRELVQSMPRIDNETPFVQIFSPGGKMGMIDGGIGCVRLKSRSNRPNYPWLMGASSTGIVHEGLIVALCEEDRDRLIADMRRFGGLRCSITGKLRFIATDDVMSRGYAKGVPQLYVEAHGVDPILNAPLNRMPLVTAAITFTSTLEEWKGLNASYVTFESGKRGDLEEAADWLEQIYVRRSYAGKVLTDFDEQTGRFGNVTFSLERLLNGFVDRTDARSALSDLRIDAYGIEQLERILSARGIFVARDLYIAGQAGALGPNSTAYGLNFPGNEPGG
jgi:hypothetical protein